MAPTWGTTAAADPAGAARAAVAGLADRLAAEARRMESEFVRLTDGLTAVHGRTMALSGLGTRLAEEVGSKLAAIRNDGVGQLVSGSYDALQRSLVASRTRLAGLDDNHAALGELLESGRRLKGIATRLGVTRLGFSIECARLDNEEASFRDFVAQLVELERVVAQLGSELTTQAGAARTEQASSGQQIRAALGELGMLAANCETVASSASGGIEAMLAACGVVATEVGTCLRAIEAHSADLVYFLQFGDIVRQKIEHVAQALANPTASGPVGRTLAVQAAQLTAVRDELAAAGQKLDGAFRGLGTCTGDLLQQVGRLAAVPGGDAGGASLDRLLGDLRGMHRLRQRADDLGVGSAQAAAKAAEVAARMAGHLDSIHETNARMHMMALNAIVNTSRLGQSAAALSVLSIQVHEIAKDSSVVVECVLPLLDRVRSSEQGMVASAGGDAADAEGQAAVQRGLDHLAELASWVTSTRADGLALADAQRLALDAARKDIGFLAGLRERVDHVLRELVAARVALGPSLDGPGGAASHAEVLAGYTMESERDVYRAVVAGGDGGAAVAAATAAPTSTGNELGDNVELF